MKKKIKNFFLNYFIYSKLGVWYLFLIASLILTIFLYIKFYEPLPQFANLMGNVAAGVIASIILLFFTTNKTNKANYLNKQVTLVNELLNELALYHKTYSVFLKGSKLYSNEKFQEKAEELRYIAQEISQYQFLKPLKNIFKRTFKQHKKNYCDNIQELSNMVHHVVFESCNKDNVIHKLKNLNFIFFELKFKLCEERIHLLNAMDSINESKL